MNSSLNQVFPPVPYSITNPAFDQSIARDKSSPYSLLEFIKSVSGLTDSLRISSFYNSYISLWNTATQTKKEDLNDYFVSIYTDFIQEIALKYSTEAERRFLTTIDYSDKYDLDIVLGFVSKKIKEIALFYSKQREDIKLESTRKKLKGSYKGFAISVREKILEFFRIKDTEEITVAEATNSVSVYVDELYNVGSEYLDKRPNDQVYDSADRDFYNLDIFLTSNTDIFALVYANIPSIIQNYQEKDSLYTNKKELTRKYMGADFYYLSATPVYNLTPIEQPGIVTNKQIVPTIKTLIKFTTTKKPSTTGPPDTTGTTGPPGPTRTTRTTRTTGTTRTTSPPIKKYGWRCFTRGTPCVYVLGGQYATEAACAERCKITTVTVRPPPIIPTTTERTTRTTGTTRTTVRPRIIIIDPTTTPRRTITPPVIRPPGGVNPPPAVTDPDADPEPRPYKLSWCCALAYNSGVGDDSAARVCKRYINAFNRPLDIDRLGATGGDDMTEIPTRKPDDCTVDSFTSVAKCQQECYLFWYCGYLDNGVRKLIPNVETSNQSNSMLGPKFRTKSEGTGYCYYGKWECQDETDGAHKWTDVKGEERTEKYPARKCVRTKADPASDGPSVATCLTQCWSRNSPSEESSGTCNPCDLYAQVRIAEGGVSLSQGQTQYKIKVEIHSNAEADCPNGTNNPATLVYKSIANIAATGLDSPLTFSSVLNPGASLTGEMTARIFRSDTDRVEDSHIPKTITIPYKYTYTDDKADSHTGPAEGDCVVTIPQAFLLSPHASINSNGVDQTNGQIANRLYSSN